MCVETRQREELLAGAEYFAEHYEDNAAVYRLCLAALRSQRSAGP